MASWREEKDEWLFADVRRVYRFRKQAASADVTDLEGLPELPSAALEELQPEPFVSAGFVSQYLETDVENGVFLLSVLFGYAVDDHRLELYVRAAKGHAARKAHRKGRGRRQSSSSSAVSSSRNIRRRTEASTSADGADGAFDDSDPGELVD